jgi:hypothetical protein
MEQVQKPLVRNASDESQVRGAKDKAKRVRDHELDDLRTILQAPQGRRLLWRLMGRCKVLNSVWEPSAKIHYNSGQQDIGHFIMAEIVEADEDAVFKMMKEAKENL